MVDEVLAAEPAVVEQFRAGKERRDQRARRPGDEADARPRRRPPGAGAPSRPPERLEGTVRGWGLCPRFSAGSDPGIRAAQYDSRRVDGKRYLITPGPTPMPPEVVAAEAAPLHHHRSPDFRALLAETIERPEARLPDRARRAAVHGSGTAAMESAIANLLSPGDRAVVASAGNFGERWLKLARAYGIEPVHVEHAVGRAARPGPDRRCRRRGRHGRGLRHPVRDVDRRRPRRRGDRPRRRARPGRCSSSTPSPASAGSSSRPTPGASTWWWPARRRRS